MRTLIFLLASVLLFSPITADAQDSRAALEAVSKALGATDLKSIEIQGGGTVSRSGRAIPRARPGRSSTCGASRAS